MKRLSEIDFKSFESKHCLDECIKVETTILTVVSFCHCFFGISNKFQLRNNCISQFTHGLMKYCQGICHQKRGGFQFADNSRQGISKIRKLCDHMIVFNQSNDSIFSNKFLVFLFFFQPCLKAKDVMLQADAALLCAEHLMILSSDSFSISWFNYPHRPDIWA